ncbi:MAG: OmpA family protein [Burkholderiales bacterium]
MARFAIGLLAALAAGCATLPPTEIAAGGNSIVLESCTSAGIVVGGGSVSFGSGSAALERALFPALDKMASVLKENPGSSIAVVGHSNGLRDAESVGSLSRRRAVAVAEYLAGQGVSRDRMDVGSRGATDPIAGIGTEAERAQNRRVDMRVRPTM